MKALPKFKSDEEEADFVIIAVPTPVTKSNLMRQTCDMSNPRQKLSART